MGFIKTGDKWVSCDDVGSSSSLSGIGHSDDGMHALISYIPLVNHGEPLSSFERMMLNRIYTMASDQRNHYEFFVARF